jgi:hypothetical protein
MENKKITEKQKIDNFLKWAKSQKESSNNKASGGSSSWNWAYAEAMEKVYKKAKQVFAEPKNSIEEVSR